MELIVDEVRYLEDENSITVLGFAIGTCKKTLIIPARIHHKPVERIAEKAFYKTNIVLVYLPDTIMFISHKAFADCKYLDKVQVGEFEQEQVNHSVTISARAFAGCSSLTEFSGFSSLTLIGKYAFSDCSSLTILDMEIFHLAENAFHNCYKIGILCLGENCILSKNSLDDCSVTTLAAVKNVQFADEILNFIFQNDIGIWCYKDAPLLDLVYNGYRVETYN